MINLATIVIPVLFIMEVVHVQAIELFIAPEGNDVYPGTRVRPLASMLRARDIIRQLREKETGDHLLEPLFESRRHQDEGVRFNGEGQNSLAVEALEKSLALDPCRAESWAAIALGEALHLRPYSPVFRQELFVLGVAQYEAARSIYAAKKGHFGAFWEFSQIFYRWTRNVLP